MKIHSIFDKGEWVVVVLVGTFWVFVMIFFAMLAREALAGIYDTNSYSIVVYTERGPLYCKTIDAESRVAHDCNHVQVYYLSEEEAWAIK